MRTVFGKVKWLQIVFGVLMLVAGGLIVVFALNNPDDISKIASIIVSIGLFLFGASAIMGGVFMLENKYFNPAFVYAAVAIAMGVTLLQNQAFLGDIIVNFVGVLLVTFAVIEIGEASAMIYFEKKRKAAIRVFTIVLFYIIGAIFLVAGILAFCYQTEAKTVVYIVTGGAIAAIGVLVLVLGVTSAMQASKSASDKKKANLAKVVANAKNDPAQIEEQNDVVVSVEEEKHPEA